MKKQDIWRRNFLSGAASFGAAAGVAALLDPCLAVGQSVGVKPADLPDFTIKELKIYLTDLKDIHRLNSTDTGELISVVTNSGIGGNNTLGDSNRSPDWLEWGKHALVGKSVIDLLPSLALYERHEKYQRVRCQTQIW